MRFTLKTWRNSRRQTFKFGKWKSVYKSEGDYAGRTVIQDQSHGFHVHQAKFVQERLSPTVIPRGRRSDKKSETTDGEKRQLRAVWGSVNWVQRETRPDVSALASIGMGSLNHSTVQDLCDANVAVERLKAEPSFGIKLPCIPIHKVRWATVPDASRAVLVGATSPGLWNNLPSRERVTRSAQHKACATRTLVCTWPQLCGFRSCVPGQRRVLSFPRSLRPYELLAVDGIIPLEDGYSTWLFSGFTSRRHPGFDSGYSSHGSLWMLLEVFHHCFPRASSHQFLWTVLSCSPGRAWFDTGYKSYVSHGVLEDEVQIQRC